MHKLGFRDGVRKVDVRVKESQGCPAMGKIEAFLFVLAKVIR